MRALLDTNILIDYLNGIEKARDEIARFKAPVISPISWMEVMVGASSDEEAVVCAFLSRFDQVVIDGSVAETAVALRRQHKMRLPDAIIWSSAQCVNALLVTRNTKDFPADTPGVRVPYEL